LLSIRRFWINRTVIDSYNPHRGATAARSMRVNKHRVIGM
jgi:hypothetical protein